MQQARGAGPHVSVEYVRGAAAGVVPEAVRAHPRTRTLHTHTPYTPTEPARQRCSGAAKAHARQHAAARAG